MNNQNIQAILYIFSTIIMFYIYKIFDNFRYKFSNKNKKNNIGTFTKIEFKNGIIIPSNPAVYKQGKTRIYSDQTQLNSMLRYIVTKR